MRLLFIPLFLFAAHIFVLHRIGDNRYPSTNTSIKQLINYFEFLKKNNYQVVTLSKLLNMIKEKKDISKVVVFTIDDGYRSFYKNGLKIFKKYNYPFTILVYVKATNQKWGDFMRWDELKDALNYGELGIHSFSHPHLAKLSNEKINKDTKKAIKIFKKHMGFVPKIYAYPYGEYDDRVKKEINKFFPFILNQNSGEITLNSPLNDINRIALTGNVDIKEKLKIKRLNAKFDVVKKDNKITKIYGEVKENLPYVDVYITNFGWKRVKVKDKKFKIYPNFKLKAYRNRVIIRYNNKMISKLILKEG